jgi:hypothetical protein
MCQIVQGVGRPGIGDMNEKPDETDAILARMERLAGELRADPDGHVLRSANELRAAFTAQSGIESAIARMRESVEMLRRANHEGRRREFQRRAPGLDHLEEVVEHELLPHLRRLGFNV